MKLIKKNGNKKYSFSTKKGTIDIIEVTAAATGIVAIGLVSMGMIAVLKECKEKMDGYKTYNSIAVSNGLETRTDDISSDEPCCEDYKVVYQDDDKLLIFVYDDDPSKRYLKTEFVERNIYVIEQPDGTYKVEFNKDDLTEEKYLEFVDNLEKENEDNIQRKRS